MDALVGLFGGHPVLDVMEGRDAAFYLPWAMKSSLVYLNLIHVLGGGFVL